ncbi:MAG TPA: carbohydrate kinase [Bacteroidota bacterium]|nr:carbohydrate kinase [Bacteroidota bacterium]
MSRNSTITCVGEAIIDFFAVHPAASLVDAPEFLRRPGGAAANVCAGIAKLGGSAAFIGSVGNDPFGLFLSQKLASYGIDVSGLQLLKDLKTRLAFVSVGKDGSRSFEFWEKDPADTHLQYRGTILKKLKRSAIVHFSSFLLLKEPSRSRTLQAAHGVINAGGITCLDPNIRFSLWDSKNSAKTVLRKMIRSCHILRLNDEEAYFLSGARSLRPAADALHRLGPDVVVVTLGADGCFFSTPRGSGLVPPFKVKSVDTTGCGDAFLAGLLTGIAAAGRDLWEIDLPQWYEICRISNAVGALTAGRQGAIDAIPTKKELEQFLKIRAC